MISDAELLQRYAKEGSEEAFSEFVRRNVDFVYNAALRQVSGNSALAEEISQAVFADLARKAGALARHQAVIGWLHTATRFAAAKAIRADSRRRERELAAHKMNEMLQQSEARESWESIKPLIDEVLGKLKERERTVVLMRFFEKKSLAEIGARLSLTETASRSCVDRSLEKMRALLARRGVTSSAAALSVALASQAAIAAPVGLAATIAGGVLTGLLAGSGGAAGMVFSFMGITKIAFGVAALLGVVAALYQTRELHRRDAALAAANTEVRGLNAQINELKGKAAAESQRAQAAEADTGKLLSAVQANAVITQGTVAERLQHAKDLAKKGDNAGALEEFLWCFQEGMPRVPAYVGVRYTYVLEEMAKIGGLYPPALEALRELREQARKRIFASADDSEAIQTYASINRVIGENPQTLALYDQFAPDDPRRHAMGSSVYDELTVAQRYAEALQAKAFPQMSSSFEFNSQMGANRPRMHDYAVKSAIDDIEVLAGAGDLEHAKSLAERLLAYDASDDTRSKLQQRLGRAGHADLLARPAK